MRYEKVDGKKMLVVSKAELGALQSCTSDELWRHYALYAYITDTSVVVTNGSVLLYWQDGAKPRPVPAGGVFVHRDTLARVKGALTSREEAGIPLNDCDSIYMLSSPAAGNTVGEVAGTVKNTVLIQDHDFPVASLGKVIDEDKYTVSAYGAAVTTAAFDPKLVVKVSNAFKNFGFDGFNFQLGNAADTPARFSRYVDGKGTLSIYLAPMRLDLK